MGNEAQKTVLITGATAGIGKTAALHLARAGHRVLASGRSPERLAALRTEAQAAGVELETVVLDVTRAESVDAAAAEVERLTQGRGLDVLINNAGYGLVGPLEMLSAADVRAQFETNVHGLLAVTRAFLPGMRRRRSGRILNVSSVGGRMTFPFMGAYNATKYAVESLSDALRIEVAPFGIQVVLIEPGLIRSEFSARAHTLSPQASVGEYAPFVGPALERFRASEERLSAGPETIARAIGQAIAARRPRARYVAPGSARLMMVLLAFLPTAWLDAIFTRLMGLHRPRQLLSGAPAIEVQS
jgi:short-subunit dehydrogenase